MRVRCSGSSEERGTAPTGWGQIGLPGKQEGQREDPRQAKDREHCRLDWLSRGEGWGGGGDGEQLWSLTCALKGWPSRQRRALCLGAVCSFSYKEELEWETLEREACLEVGVQAKQPAAAQSQQMRSRAESKCCPWVSRTRLGQEGKTPARPHLVRRGCSDMGLVGLPHRCSCLGCPGGGPAGTRCEAGVWNAWGKMRSKLTFRILAMK